MMSWFVCEQTEDDGVATHSSSSGYFSKSHNSSSLSSSTGSWHQTEQHATSQSLSALPKLEMGGNNQSLVPMNCKELSLFTVIFWYEFQLI